jgi:signal peptidase I
VRRRVVSWAVSIAAAASFVLVFEVEVAQPFRIPSASMEPTLKCARPGYDCTATFSDRVIAAKIVYRFRDPERGEIAVFHAPPAAARLCSGGGTFVKRVIGLPGEVVGERHGYVTIDGRTLSEPYVSPANRDHLTRTWPRLGPGQYFVLGDNRAHSCDSRVWGPVPRAAFIGPVVATYWPPTDWSIP